MKTQRNSAFVAIALGVAFAAATLAPVALGANDGMNFLSENGVATPQWAADARSEMAFDVKAFAGGDHIGATVSHTEPSVWHYVGSYTHKAFSGIHSPDSVTHWDPSSKHTPDSCLHTPDTTSTPCPFPIDG